jgi:thiol-disulfide isomerase/thioredoxin
MGAVMPAVKRFGGLPDALSLVRLAAVAAALVAPGFRQAPASEPAGDPLLGRTRPAAILDVAPEWRRRYDEYRPEAADLEIIRHAPEGSLVMVYFGSWCSDSRIAVPHFLRILDEARAPHLKARYVGVDRSKKEPADRLEGVGLELVPTFVLSIDNREVGRIVETPATTLEHDLALLFRRAASPGP